MGKFTTSAFRAMLAAAVVGAGFSASSLYTSGVANADAVKLEAPAYSPGFADIVEAVSPAVVSVRVKSNIAPVSDRGGFRAPPGFENLPPDHPFNRFFREFDRGDRGERRGERQRPRRAQPVSQGSGFFISGDGFLVTNNHVIENGTEFEIVLNDGTTYGARLIGADPRTDLAVLKVDEGDDFTYVQFGDDNAARVGEWVVAVGNPFGLGGTVTAGIISARGRDIGAGPYDDFLQIDAAVNRGNSGGPTFNLSGEVVGVNTAIFSPSGGNVGIAFAVPASVAKDVVAELMDDGVVDRGWLGVRIQPVTDDIAESLGLSEAAGAIVADAESGAPADKSGIRAGDVIVAVNGDAIDDPRDLSRSIADFDPGSDVEITVVRNGDTRTFDVELGELPSPEVARAAPEPAPAEPAEMDSFGLTVVPADDGKGVAVVDVDPGSLAAEGGIRPGDVITEVNNAPVNSVADLEASIDQVREQGRGAALMRVENGDNSRYLAMPLKG